MFVANAAATAFKPLLEVEAASRREDVRDHDRLVPPDRAAHRATHAATAGASSPSPAWTPTATSPATACSPSAKAALETLTRYLAVELGPRGITVNAVNPGYVDTDSVTLYFGDDEARRRVLRGDRGRDAAPRARRRRSEVADLVAFLCSPEAAWMQGQVLYLDGGIFLHAPGHSVRWWKRTGRRRRSAAHGLRPARRGG